MRNRLVRFTDIGIEPRLVKALRREGIKEPFEVQMEAIPDSLLGRDVCCRAPTGSGKTLAFGLPLLSRTAAAKPKRPTSLILTPTRELAEQIRVVLGPLAKSLGHRIMSIYGGTPYKGQINKLASGVEIIVACPGRLLDLINRKALSLGAIDIVVLDEADRMADMGFMDPVCDILDRCNRSRQTILFSATLDDEVADLVESYQSDPVVIEVGPKEVSMDLMEHIFWKVDSSNKLVLSEYISQNFSPSIIFCKTRAGSNRLGKQLTDLGASVAVLHGGMNQKQRDRSMRKFSAQNVRTLIATDVASRGIDIQGVNCVLHFDPPENGKAYKHRSGRTARAGKKGIVVSLVQRSQMRYYKRIQKQVGISSEITEPRPELLDFEIGQVNPREGGVGGSAKNRRRKKKNDHGIRKEGRYPGNKKKIKKKNGGRHRQGGAKPKQKRRRRT